MTAAVLLLLAGFLASGIWLWFALRPAAAAGAPEAAPREFEVRPGQGFRSIAHELARQGIVRSALAFEAYAVLTERSRILKPGKYALSAANSGTVIVSEIAAGPAVDIAVTVPEGATARDIDGLLARAGVTKAGEFLAFVRAQSSLAEGKLFPDTYRFYFDSPPQKVFDKMRGNFDRRAGPLLANDPQADRDLILASLIEKEVPDQADREIVAGILIKRASAGMALQVDASLCYAKAEADPASKCHPITAIDKKIASPYNTYLQSGWPPGPIANPGILALEAALHPKDSPYWYYLSDPKSGKTIFARTLDEQVANQLKYLN